MDLHGLLLDSSQSCGSNLQGPSLRSNNLEIMAIKSHSNLAIIAMLFGDADVWCHVVFLCIIMLRPVRSAKGGTSTACGQC